jgi:hypothetical protein
MTGVYQRTTDHGKSLYPNNLKMLFLREIKGLEARQRLEALVMPKRQALTRLQELLAPLIRLAEMAFPQQLKTSIFRLFGYKPACAFDEPLLICN